MDEQPDVKSLYARVEKLERQNRWMKRVGIVASVLVAAVTVMGQAQTNKAKKVVEANEFHLIDDSGRVRAEISMWSVGGLSAPRLCLKNEAGELDVEIADAASLPSSQALYHPTMGPHLTLGKFGGNGSLTLQAGTFESPSATLSVIGLFPSRILLSAGDTGSNEKTPGVFLFGKNNKVLWSSPKSHVP